MEMINGLVQCFSALVLNRFTHSHTDGGRAAMQSAGLAAGSNLGFSVLSKDTFTCGLGRTGLKPQTL